MTDPNSPEERERLRKLLEKTCLGQRMKEYNEKWLQDKADKEKEIEEHKELSIFENEIESKERGLLTHPINPLSERHPHFKSLTIHQVNLIEKYLRAGLSSRDVVKAIHTHDFSTSEFTVRQIKKELEKREMTTESVDA